MDTPPKRSPINTVLIVLVVLLVGALALRTYDRAAKPERERQARQEQTNAVNELRRWGETGNEEKFRVTLEKVKLTDEQARTILDSAAYQGQTNIVRILLDRGWDVKGKKGGNALDSAACFGFTDVVELLLAHGADPNIVDEKTNQTPLGWASYGGHTDCVKILLDAGAEINTIAYIDFGGTPLMLAARRGHIDTVKLLLSRGANSRFKSEWGETALSLAKHIEKPVNIKRNPYASSYDSTPERAKKNRKNVIRDSRRIAAIVKMLRAAGATE